MEKIHLVAEFVLLSVAACNDGAGETVDSSYIENVWTEPEYKFLRNGRSSVDLLECRFLKDPIDYFYSSFLKKADIRNEQVWQRARKYYEEGEYGLKPKEELCSSPTHRNDRTKVVSDFDGWIDTSKRIAGFYATGTDNALRRQETEPGQCGYIGRNIADENILFADEKGMVVSELFSYAIMGAVYLDKILNWHLNEEVIFTSENCNAHENLELLAGRNYTQIEHHLDLAKGYYEFWRPLAASDGIPVLWESDRKISYAFVEARQLLARSQYEQAKGQFRIIRRELSKVVGARVMNTLLGPNTLVNMGEDPKYAFGFISRACGLIYALQFTLKEDGTSYFTYDEVKAFLDEMTEGDGFWNQGRLLAGEEQSGSLKNIATRVGERFGISLQDIER